MCVSFTITLRQQNKTEREPVLRRLRATTLGFCLWVIITETHIKLEKTTSSVLSVNLIHLWIK